MIKEYCAKSKKEAILNARRELGPDIIILGESIVKRDNLFGSPISGFKIKVLKETPKHKMSIKKEVDFLSTPAFGAFGKSAFPRQPLEKEIKISGNNSKIKVTGIGTYGKNAIDIFDDDFEDKNPEYKNKMDELSARARITDMTKIIDGGNLDFKKMKADFLEKDLHISVTEKVLHFLQAYKSLNKNEIEIKVREYINEKIKTQYNIDFDTQHQKAVFFLGTTGVGKTTTLIKFAALVKNKIKKNIAIINLDTGKLAADEFVGRYADILEIPFTTAHNLFDYRDAVSAYSDKDLILVDTMGLIPDEDNVREYKGYIDIDAEIHKFLLISADSNFSKLKKVLSKFSQFAPDNIIFTKLDEAEDLITLFNYIFNFDIPLSFITKGKDIPDDIDKISSRKIAEKFAKMICGGFC